MRKCMWNHSRKFFVVYILFILSELIKCYVIQVICLSLTRLNYNYTKLSSISTTPNKCMMSSSIPSTPLSQRHQFGVVEDATVQSTTLQPSLPSRIPQPSPPQPLRRSLSLRLRTVDQPDNGTKFSSYSSNDSTTTAQTSPTLALKQTTSNSSNHKISSSKSLSFIGNDGMAHNGATTNGQHHSKESPTATNGHHNHKFSPTSTASPFPHRKQSGSHEHGMVSVFDFIFHYELFRKFISYADN